MDDVERVRSHPQALAQCERYLSNHGWTAEATYDTAGSARDLAAKPSPGWRPLPAGWRASSTTWRSWTMDIEDSPYNYTRFFVLSLDDAHRAPSATRPRWSLPHATNPGRLYECLGEFAKRHVNLSQDRVAPAPQSALAVHLLPGL